MAEQKLHVVTKDGQKISTPMSLEEANQKAADLKAILESQQHEAVIKVVPVLME